LTEKILLNTAPAPDLLIEISRCRNMGRPKSKIVTKITESVNKVTTLPYISVGKFLARSKKITNEKILSVRFINKTYLLSEKTLRYVLKILLNM
jgi:hypothetical protein